ncbi:MAG: hypothetical protein FWG14_09065 [Peptococcaceae bacterium]|nr:hypothetical protein [Peptococcaceae bacterium]
MDGIKIKVYGNGCRGCGRNDIETAYEEWQVGIDVCCLYHCATHLKQFHDCGVCQELPCQMFYDTVEHTDDIYDMQHDELEKFRKADVQKRVDTLLRK